MTKNIAIVAPDSRTALQLLGPLNRACGQQPTAPAINVHMYVPPGTDDTSYPYVHEGSAEWVPGTPGSLGIVTSAASAKRANLPGTRADFAAIIHIDESDEPPTTPYKAYPMFSMGDLCLRDADLSAQLVHMVAQAVSQQPEPPRPALEEKAAAPKQVRSASLPPVPVPNRQLAQPFGHTLNGS